MLEHIHIENLALIDSIDIDFSSGFTVLTGETGAGKSIILDAIAFISGEKGAKEKIRRGEKSMRVDAVFSHVSKAVTALCDTSGIPLDDGALFLSRTFTEDGKNISRINGTPQPLALLRDIASLLIGIHGQHDSERLLKKEMHLVMLDRYADTSAALAEYSEAYHTYTSLKAELESLQIDEAEKARMTEMLRYQIGEIKEAKLKVGDEEKLLDQKKKISAIEKISEGVRRVYAMLHEGSPSATELIDESLHELHAMAKYTDECEDCIERLQSVREELYDIAECVSDMARFDEVNPAAILDAVEKKLYDLGKLKRKYGGSVEDILAYLTDAEKRLEELENTEYRREELSRYVINAFKETKRLARHLSDKRKQKAAELTACVEKELSFLDMEKVKFRVDFAETEPTKTGTDDVRMMLCANMGSDFMPLDKTASGGELSRVMLSLVNTFSDKDGVGTRIFDEIDTGVSGKSSRKIGIKLKNASFASQVMCVTHSAQIASLADTHLFVQKRVEGDSTVVSVTPLTGDDRVEETARIISGLRVTENAMQTAKELISDSKNYEYTGETL